MIIENVTNRESFATFVLYGFMDHPERDHGEVEGTSKDNVNRPWEGQWRVPPAGLG